MFAQRHPDGGEVTHHVVWTADVKLEHPAPYDEYEHFPSSVEA
ncbi:MAG TPA: hypothetical protein VIL34_10885 [Actinopolymorphaceae bacterium]